MLPNLVGKQFNSWIVISRINNEIFECKCKCGNLSQIRYYDLIKNKSRRCKTCADLLRGSRTHNMTTTRLYRIWKDMKGRCFRTTSTSYKNYGGRGITVCDEWINNFESFYHWAMSNGYLKTLTIDRIDVNGNYEPSNCRWATRTVQNNNTRRNHYVYYQGKKYTVSQLAKKYGLDPLVVYKRLKRDWTVDEAVTIKLNERRNKHA